MANPTPEQMKSHPNAGCPQGDGWHAWKWDNTDACDKQVCMKCNQSRPAKKGGAK
jgi:hypothetical protein